MFVLFVIKLIENLLGTAKTILIQKNKEFLAAIMNGLSTYIIYLLTGIYVESDNSFTIYALSLGAGVGTYIAMKINDKISKDRTYINVVMSSDIDEIKSLRDYCIEHKITSVVTNSYTKEWDDTLVITIYAETKTDSRLIDKYLEECDMKFKRITTKH